ncbi:UPF0175 family protein [Tamlana sp. I1]|uniref:UPF0175 family protein n=1 Tax=Tamlana sp. I1 TaxID=2762061 RepID=UPI00293C050A|nr:UPF0175 family protein [Tamlana sp. I1]
MEKIEIKLNFSKKNIKFEVKQRTMNIQTISIDFPNDILLALNESESELKKRIKVTLAIQLYKLQKLTIGKASQLSGMSRLEFEKELSNNKISISNLNEEDILGDIEKLK